MAARLSIVDAHHHVWDLGVRPQPWLATDPGLAPLRRNFWLTELAPQAAAAGVSASAVVQTVTEPGETPELLGLALAGALIGAVVGWTDLSAPGVADALAELRALPGGQFLAGIRHPLLTEPDPGWINRPEVQRGLRSVAAAGLVFDLVLRPSQLPAAVRAVASLPDVTFVLDHLGNVDVGRAVDNAWAASFAELAALPNTTCKLSGILSVLAPESEQRRAACDSRPPSISHLRPYLHLALDHFGSDRLMFGSDWPVCTLGASYDAVVATAVALTSTLSKPEQAAIMGGTARRLYRITA
jgi:L-fuconolactonase